jgi:hypothetical protein
LLSACAALHEKNKFIGWMVNIKCDFDYDNKETKCNFKKGTDKYKIRNGAVDFLLVKILEARVD